MTKGTRKNDAAECETAQTESQRKRATFIKILSQNANVRLSCMAAGIGRGRAYEWRKQIPEFRAAWQEAIQQACDILEAEAWRRAMREKNPSDTLLIFLLKAYRPKKFRENMRHEHSGPNGAPINHKHSGNIDVDLTDFDDTQASSYLAKIARAGLVAAGGGAPGDGHTRGASRSDQKAKSKRKPAVGRDG